MQPHQFPSAMGKRIQLGHVVSDLEATLDFWTRVMGVGPFVVLDSSVGDRHFIHREQHSPVDFTIGFSYLGDVMIEFIKPLDQAPSPYREFLDSGRQGLHHIGFWPDDFERSCSVLQEAGFAEVSSIRYSDGVKDVIYCDTPPAVGIMVEVGRLTPVRSQFLEGVRRLAIRWDGSRPIRRYPDRATFISSRDCAHSA